MKHYNILVLDDDKKRLATFRNILEGRDYKNVEYLENAPASVSLLATLDHWDVVFLDHDLGGGAWQNSSESDTGAEVARWIAEHRPVIRQIVLHSHNPAGAHYMLKILWGNGYNAMYIPFNLLIEYLSWKNCPFQLMPTEIDVAVDEAIQSTIETMGKLNKQQRLVVSSKIASMYCQKCGSRSGGCRCTKPS